jgi:hypothetical protein
MSFAGKAPGIPTKGEMYFLFANKYGKQFTLPKGAALQKRRAGVPHCQL